MFSVVSLCQSFSPPVEVPCDHCPWCIGPHCIGTPPLNLSPSPSHGHLLDKGHHCTGTTPAPHPLDIGPHFTGTTPAPHPPNMRPHCTGTTQAHTIWTWDLTVQGPIMLVHPAGTSIKSVCFWAYQSVLTRFYDGGLWENIFWSIHKWSIHLTQN